MWCHIKPILQVILLATAMLVSSHHSLVLENTIKCPRPFNLVHITIPNYNQVTRILVHTLGWNLKSCYEVNPNNSLFCCFSPYRAIQTGNQRAGQNRAHIGVYRVVQTLYTMIQTTHYKVSESNVSPVVMFFELMKVRKQYNMPMRKPGEKMRQNIKQRQQIYNPTDFQLS